MDGDELGVSAEWGAAERADFGLRPMANVLGVLYAAGATLALLAVALPHPARASSVALLLIVANAYTVAGLLLWRAERVPRLAIPLVVAWGSVIIAAFAYFSGESPSPLVFFYLWVFLYASYFFSARETAVQIAVAGLTYAALLIGRPPANGILVWWLVGMGTLVVTAILIRSMHARVELLIARLYEAARTDPLTKLSNRRGFRELLDLELERARRSSAHMTVALADLDHFKEVNDRSGHATGDAALQRLAGLLAAGKRQLDGVARVGGEEFALVLPDTDEHDAYTIAERLRGRVREEFANDTVPVTMSLGVASYPQHGETAASLLRAADSALYAAKQSGRNTTVLHSEAISGAGLEPGEARDVAAERFLALALDLSETVDQRLSGSARHSETVGRYAEMIARELGLPQQVTSRVRLAGLLHDLGKVGVPDEILKKPASLSEEETRIIRRHPELGEQILEHPSFADVRVWVGAHHERPDGSGYPRGLSGAELSLEAQILAVADAYEAMTSDRAYRPAIGHAAARRELERCAGTQFHPPAVEALLTVLAREAERAQALLAGA